MKYNLLNTYDAFSVDKSQESPDPTPSVEMVVPGPDSIPLSVLNHPAGKRDEIDFAAYDPPVLSPTEGDHPVLVLCLNSSSKVLTGDQAWSVLRIHLRTQITQ